MKDLLLVNSQRDFKEIRERNEFLNRLGAPHVESFNHMLEQGLIDCVNSMVPVRFETAKEKIELKIESINILPPMVPPKVAYQRSKIYPTECRQLQSTYGGMCVVRVGWYVNDTKVSTFTKELGELPVMLQSNVCHLNGLSPKQLIEHGEHEHEWGGYFIINGNEKIIRMLLLTRKNYPVTVKRNTWKTKGDHFSDMGVMIRCVQTDQTSSDNILHYLTTGRVKLMITHNKAVLYIDPILLLKALTKHTDKYIYEQLVQGFEDDENQYYISKVAEMLRGPHSLGCHIQEHCKRYLGGLFRSKFMECPPWFDDNQICDFLLDHCVLIHLNDYEDKFNLLVFMIQKLYQCVHKRYKVENVDSVMMQEILLGGHLYQKVVKDRIHSWLGRLKFEIVKKSTEDPDFSLTSENMLKLKTPDGVKASMQNFLSTGNLKSQSSLVAQTSGLVIAVDNINRMRYMAHFRSVHRGSFFVEMRTTEARQLLPDAWGFICPVHTPDGTNCGLLNHLTVDCVISQSPDPLLVENVPKEMSKLGMIPKSFNQQIDFKNYAVVLLEGKLIGYVRFSDCERIEQQLRLLKIEGKRVPNMMEIAVVPNKKSGQYPGFFLFVGPARMMRPVINLQANQKEYIGTFEQVYMNISLCEKENDPNLTTHTELSKTSFLSNLANLIPLPDFNQSPRNMYQCQMGKQTMGTPCQNWPYQAANRLYRLQTPASPLFRPLHYDKIDMDNFPMGTNAIVAVISYTGYDMEDAMVINKSAYERGFAHGSIYKSEFIELPKNTGDSYFARDPNNKSLENFIDSDGLPFEGRMMKCNETSKDKEVYYCYYNANEKRFITIFYRGKEDCIVDSIKLCGSFQEKSTRTFCITFRVPRNPNVGDKFASRAGQKGICSQKWPDIDLPFTESGLIPDIIFNPHGFPSRMTIAMMIEMMAGKSASLHGHLYDASPFQFSENDTAIDYFGKLLVSGGYNYHGTETLYSGIDGREMTAKIFFGIVHYQRLRHMVNDKYQVRSTGTDDILTRQPVKGRSRGGGVRFGEMEQNALLAHGASFLLRDRLFQGSDRIMIEICQTCENILAPIRVLQTNRESKIVTSKTTCKLCQNEAAISYVEIPYILKFLATQLASVNIKVRFGTKSV